MHDSTPLGCVVGRSTSWAPAKAASMRGVRRRESLKFGSAFAWINTCHARRLSTGQTTSFKRCTAFSAPW